MEIRKNNQKQFLSSAIFTRVNNVVEVDDEIEKIKKSNKSVICFLKNCLLIRKPEKTEKKVIIEVDCNSCNNNTNNNIDEKKIYSYMNNSIKDENNININDIDSGKIDYKNTIESILYTENEKKVSFVKGEEKEKKKRIYSIIENGLKIKKIKEKKNRENSIKNNESLFLLLNKKKIRDFDFIDTFWEAYHEEGNLMICNSISTTSNFPIHLEYVQLAARILMYRHQALRSCICKPHDMQSFFSSLEGKTKDYSFNSKTENENDTIIKLKKYAAKMKKYCWTEMEEIKADCEMFEFAEEKKDKENKLHREEDDDEEWLTCLHEEQRKKFNTFDGPLWRIKLIESKKKIKIVEESEKEENEEVTSELKKENDKGKSKKEKIYYKTYFVGSFHHAIIDGLSRQIFWDELLSLISVISRSGMSDKNVLNGYNVGNINNKNNGMHSNNDNSDIFNDKQNAMRILHATDIPPPLLNSLKSNIFLKYVVSNKHINPLLSKCVAVVRSYAAPYTNPFSHCFPSEIYKDKSVSSMTSIIPIRINAEKLKKLLKICKAKKMTLNGVITAAAAAAMKSMLVEKKHIHDKLFNNSDEKDVCAIKYNKTNNNKKILINLRRIYKKNLSNVLKYAQKKKKKRKKLSKEKSYLFVNKNKSRFSFSLLPTSHFTSMHAVSCKRWIGDKKTDNNEFLNLLENIIKGIDFMNKNISNNNNQLMHIGANYMTDEKKKKGNNLLCHTSNSLDSVMNADTTATTVYATDNEAVTTADYMEDLYSSYNNSFENSKPNNNKCTYNDVNEEKVEERYKKGVKENEINNLKLTVIETKKKCSYNDDGTFKVMKKDEMKNLTEKEKKKNINAEFSLLKLRFKNKTPSNNEENKIVQTIKAETFVDLFKSSEKGNITYKNESSNDSNILISKEGNENVTNNFNSNNINNFCLSNSTVCMLCASSSTATILSFCSSRVPSISISTSASTSPASISPSFFSKSLTSLTSFLDSSSVPAASSFCFLSAEKKTCSSPCCSFLDSLKCMNNQNNNKNKCDKNNPREKHFGSYAILMPLNITVTSKINQKNEFLSFAKKLSENVQKKVSHPTPAKAAFGFRIMTRFITAAVGNSKALRRVGFANPRPNAFLVSNGGRWDVDFLKNTIEFINLCLTTNVSVKLNKLKDKKKESSSIINEESTRIRIEENKQKLWCNNNLNIDKKKEKTLNEPLQFSVDESWSCVVQHNCGINLFAHNVVTIDGSVCWSLQYHSNFTNKKLAEEYAKRVVDIINSLVDDFSLL